MDGRDQPLVLGYVFFALFVVAFVAVLVWRKVVGKRELGYLALVEYWVYGSTTKLPADEQIMDRMINGNPHNRPGRPSIGAREGMVFSDIRLHGGVGLREKNPEAFRPDLIDSDVVPSAEILRRLSDCETVTTLRYASQARLRDFRHLQFMPHYADAIAQLTDGTVVFDTITKQIHTAEAFHAQLQANNNAERSDFHVRVKWQDNGESGVVQTFGLAKIGLDEWCSEALPIDQETLAMSLAIRAVQAVFRDPAMPSQVTLQEFGDDFVLDWSEKSDRGRKLRIFRKVAP